MTSNKEHEGGYTWTTYAQRLEDAGISWKVYQHQDNYGCNVLEYFKAFKKSGPRFGLIYQGHGSSPEGQFEYDAINDMLPAGSWIIPPGSNRSIRTICRPTVRRLSRVRSMPSLPTSRRGPKRSSF